MKTHHRFFIATVATLLALTANAADNSSGTSQSGQSSQAGQTAQTGKTGHGKNLNFDGDYVETMGKGPLDSLTALSESQKGRDSHLYKKRTEFAPETAETLKQSRFEQ
jgi:hypothetical protein